MARSLRLGGGNRGNADAALPQGARQGLRRPIWGSRDTHSLAQCGTCAVWARSDGGDGLAEERAHVRGQGQKLGIVDR